MQFYATVGRLTEVITIVSYEFVTRKTTESILKVALGKVGLIIKKWGVMSSKTSLMMEHGSSSMIKLLCQHSNMLLWVQVKVDTTRPISAS